ncbi:hypothetical protein NCC49_003846 [Naganishia albida]|nr:hypothetical protein NCC49_003846 [Naganishia albida]
MLTNLVATLFGLFMKFSSTAHAARAAPQPMDIPQPIGVRDSSSPDMCIGVGSLENGAQVVEKSCSAAHPASSTPF